MSGNPLPIVAGMLPAADFPRLEFHRPKSLTG